MQIEDLLAGGQERWIEVTADPVYVLLLTLPPAFPLVTPRWAAGVQASQLTQTSLLGQPHGGIGLSLSWAAAVRDLTFLIM